MWKIYAISSSEDLWAKGGVEPVILGADGSTSTFHGILTGEIEASSKFVEASAFSASCSWYKITDALDVLHRWAIASG